MRAITKDQLAKEITNRRKLAYKRGHVEDTSQTVSRIFGSLMKTWVTPEGKTWTLRAYLLKYNRKEYVEYIQFLKRRCGEGYNFFQQGKILNVEGLNLNHWYLADLKIEPSQSFDGRMPLMNFKN